MLHYHLGCLFRPQHYDVAIMTMAMVEHINEHSIQVA